MHSYLKFIQSLPQPQQTDITAPVLQMETRGTEQVKATQMEPWRHTEFHGFQAEVGL